MHFFSHSDSVCKRPFVYRQTFMCTITCKTRWSKLEVLALLRSRDIFAFAMYYVYITFGPSLLIIHLGQLLLNYSFTVRIDNRGGIHILHIYYQYCIYAVSEGSPPSCFITLTILLYSYIHNKQLLLGDTYHSRVVSIFININAYLQHAMEAFLHPF